MVLYNIQVLRAIAALLVVHAHAAGPAGLKLAWDGGANGVDLFFVISGFIIAHVGSVNTSQFLLRRVIRIVPIYWSSTLALFGLVNIAPHLFRTASSDVGLLLQSLLFIPSADNVHTSDGLPHPTLAGGWTLNYEMYFYVVFAIALWVAPRRRTIVCSVLLLSVVAFVELVELRANPVAHFYGYPIVIEFVLGMLAFHTTVWLQTCRKSYPRLEQFVLGAVVLSGVMAIAFAEALFGESARWLVSGLPSFGIVVAAVALERRHDARITNRWVLAVGDASYVLYLMQAYVLYGITRLILGPVDMPEVAGQLLTVALMLLCSVAAILVYRFYEQPLLRVLKRTLIRN